MSNPGQRYSAAGQRGGSTFRGGKHGNQASSSSNAETSTHSSSESKRGGHRGGGNHRYQAPCSTDSGTSGGHRNTNRTAGKNEPRFDPEPFSCGHYINLISVEDLKVNVSRNDKWPLTMKRGVWNYEKSHFELKTTYPQRMLEYVTRIIVGYGFMRTDEMSPLSVAELKALIDIACGFATDIDVFTNIPIRDALRDGEYTDEEVKILAKLPIKHLDDRAKFLIARGTYRLIPATENYSAYGSGFYSKLIEIGGLKKDSDAWENLKLRTNYEYDLMQLVIANGGVEILPPALKKLQKIVEGWPQTSYQLLATKRPSWVLGDLPEDAHPAHKMVAIINSSNSSYEQRMLVQELCDDTPIFTPVLSYRASFRSILQGYGIPMREWLGQRNAYPIEYALMTEMVDMTTDTDYIAHAKKAREFIFQELQICCEYGKPSKEGTTETTSTTTAETTKTPAPAPEDSTPTAPTSESIPETTENPAPVSNVASSSNATDTPAAETPVETAPKPPAIPAEYAETGKDETSIYENVDRMIVAISKESFQRIKTAHAINGYMHCVTAGQSPYTIFSVPVIAHLYDRLFMTMRKGAVELAKKVKKMDGETAKSVLEAAIVAEALD